MGTMFETGQLGAMNVDGSAHQEYKQECEPGGTLDPKAGSIGSTESPHVVLLSVEDPKRVNEKGVPIRIREGSQPALTQILESEAPKR